MKIASRSFPGRAPGNELGELPEFVKTSSGRQTSGVDRMLLIFQRRSLRANLPTSKADGNFLDSGKKKKPRNVMALKS